MNLPNTKQEYDAIIERGFNYYKQGGMQFRKTHLTEPYYNLLEQIKTEYFTDGADKASLFEKALTICKTIVSYSQPSNFDLYPRHEPPKDEFDRIVKSFTDDGKLSRVHLGSRLFTVNKRDVNNKFTIPSFVIVSDEPLAHSIKQMSLFSLLPDDDEEVEPNYYDK